jgi:hypothetical protein
MGQSKRLAVRQVRPCGNCGRLRPILAVERCGACYVYRWRHGRERPPDGGRSRSQPRPLCITCGERPAVGRRERCRRCHEYYRRYGVERGARPSRLGPAPAPPRPCHVCGQQEHLIWSQRCRRCHAYWYKYGRERPAHLWASGAQLGQTPAGDGRVALVAASAR